jgi:hypothetical protein
VTTGRFPLDSTTDEEDFGFAAIESPTGEHALVAILSRGLRAVKTTASDGSTEYIVCNERLEPLYNAARTLEELRERFARRSGRHELP